MSEKGADMPKIEIASPHVSIDELRKKAQEPKKEEKVPVEKESFDEQMKEAVKSGIGPGLAAGMTAALEEVGEAIGRKIAGKAKEETKIHPKETEAEKSRSFVEIQGELRGLIKLPDPAKEAELKAERAKLLRKAKDVGVFDSLKGHLVELQTTNDFKTAYDKIRSIDTERLEQESRGLAGWESNFEGMLSEYKEGSVLNMLKVMYEARGAQDEARKVEREIELRGWGLPPASLESKAREYWEEKRKKEQEIKKREEIEKKPPYEWVRHVIFQIAEAEKFAEDNLLRSFEQSDLWKKVEETINLIPEKTGSTDPELSEYFAREYPEGVFLKEKLRLYFNARRRLMNRYIEIKKAGGSLISMGVGKEKIAQFEVIAPRIENLRPEDFYLIVHSDELFPEVTKQSNDQVSIKEKKELAPNVAKAMSIWWEVGIQYDTVHPEFKTIKDKGGEVATAPTFAESLINSDSLARLRKKITEHIGSKNAEDLAHRLFTVTLTFPFMDRKRKSFSGKSEDRDLMYFDTKRVNDFLIKEAEPGVDWTIGRYWASSVQAGEKIQVLSTDDPKARRRKTLTGVNYQSSVFRVQENFPEGQLVGDFFSTTIEGVDRVDRKLINYAVDTENNPKVDRFGRKEGWKNIPFLHLTEDSYGGTYFGYNLGIAQGIEAELTNQAPKLEEIMHPSTWNNRKRLFDRLFAISPTFNSNEYLYRAEIIKNTLRRANVKREVERIDSYEDLEEVYQGSELDHAKRILNDNVKREIGKEAEKRAKAYNKKHLELLRQIYAEGILWTGSLEALQRDMERSGDQSLFSFDDVVEIRKALRSSAFLNESSIRRLNTEIKEMKFSGRAKNQRR